MLSKVLESGQVTRYHAKPPLNRLLQTDADHSWGVAVIIAMLHPDPSLELFQAALFHDCGEFWAGDLPHDFKAAAPSLAAEHAQLEHAMAQANGVPATHLSVEERKWLKFADRLESFFFMRRHGVHWDHKNTTDLVAMAISLDCYPQLQEVMNG